MPAFECKTHATCTSETHHDSSVTCHITSTRYTSYPHKGSWRKKNSYPIENYIALCIPRKYSKEKVKLRRVWVKKPRHDHQKEVRSKGRLSERIEPRVTPHSSRPGNNNTRQAIFVLSSAHTHICQRLIVSATATTNAHHLRHQVSSKDNLT